MTIVRARYCRFTVTWPELLQTLYLGIVEASLPLRFFALVAELSRYSSLLHSVNIEEETQTRRLACESKVKTLFQFFAKTRQDMEQWVTKICELDDEKNDCKEKETTREVDVNIVANGTTKQPNDQEDPSPKKERYRDVSPSTDIDLPDKSSIEPTVTNEQSHESSNVSVLTSSQSHSPTPPPLPARVPQRLPIPSLQHSSQEFPDEEEDDIYHKIEDFRDTVRYGNVSEASQIKMNDDRSNEESSATYDDIQASVRKKDKFNEKRMGKSIGSGNELTYDDTGTTLKDNKVTNEQDKFSSYDDVEVIVRLTFISSSFYSILFHPIFTATFHAVHLSYTECLQFKIEQGTSGEENGGIDKVTAKEILFGQSEK